MNRIKKSLFLFVGFGSLLLTAACGGGGNGGGFGSGGGSNGFSNSSLSGQYAYQVSGFDLTQGGTAFREAGVFTADGNGHLTGGTDDSSEGTSIFTGAVSGTYTVHSDGTLVINLLVNGSPSQFAGSIASSSKLYLVESDGLGVGSGVAEKQNTALFNVPSGTYAFRLHTLSGQGSTATVGVFTVSNGTVVSGSVDQNHAGTVTSPTLTGGTFNSPDSSSGRGSGSLVNSAAGTITFFYYVIDATHFFFFSTQAGVLGTGQAEMQTGGPFSASSFSGSYAFASQGDTLANLTGANTVGRFTANGTGGITSGALDSVVDTVSTSNGAFTGSYTMTGSGRAAVTLSTPNGTVQQFYWMVSPSRAFLLTNSAVNVEDGTIDLQQGSNFSAGSLTGIYAFFMDGGDSGGSKQRVGTLNFNGSGTLKVGEAAFTQGVGTTASLSGTYTVNANGRATGSVTNLSNNLVFYMISPTDAYVLQNDTGVEIQGAMSQQH